MNGVPVLFSQNFCRRHDGHLIIVLNGYQRRHQRHEGLAASNITLNQTVHRMRRHHVRFDFRQHSPLSFCQFKREQMNQLFSIAVCHLEGDPLFQRHSTFLKGKPQLPEEEFVKRQRLVCRCRSQIQIGKVGLKRGQMYLAKRLPERRKLCGTELGGDNAFYVRQKDIHDFAHNPAHSFLMYPFRQRIDRHDSSEISRIRGQQCRKFDTLGQPLYIRMMHLALIPELVHLTAENAGTPDLPDSLHPYGIGIKPLAGNRAGFITHQRLKHTPATFGRGHIRRQNRPEKDSAAAGAE